MVVKTIAIDGPAGSGKSTLGQKLADQLGYLYFDTGVMYRAVTWAALVADLDFGNEQEVTQLANTVVIDVLPPSVPDGRSYDVVLDGKDVTWEIRRPEVELNVSVVSAYPGVRRALTSSQRSIGQRGKVVMVGRDIGTVVMPDAGIKIFLDASLEERARRRCQEMNQRGETAVFNDVLSSMITRDKIDSTRQIAPLRPAEDAYILKSDDLDAGQVLQKVLTLVEREKVERGNTG
jgi:CMP/dCMP kinase